MIHFAPAKINIGLHVLSKRADGFHNLDSLFYPIPWYDVVEIIPSDKCSVQMYHFNETVELHKNLAFRAWQVLAQRYSIAPVAIHIMKSIPSGAGLGGGSSNAASVFTLMNEFFQLHLSDSDLAALSLEVGSDCPFFLYQKPAFVSGRGEFMKPAPELLKGYYILVVKPVSLSDGVKGIATAEAYASITPGDKRPEIETLVKMPLHEWRHYIENDFQSLMVKKYPELSDILNTLYASGALYASMSGTGSALYGIFAGQPSDNIFNHKQFSVFSARM